jgi:hypothetical protein
MGRGAPAPPAASLLLKQKRQTPDRDLKLARKRMKEVQHG